MRDINRIKTTLEKLEELWLENPDLRLGQLLMVVAMTGEQNPKLFYMEDDIMLQQIESRLDEFRKRNEEKK